MRVIVMLRDRSAAFLSELPSAKEILCVECDPPVRVNHPHRQLQLYGGRKSAGTEVVARRSTPRASSWMQSKSGIKVADGCEDEVTCGN